MPRAHTSRRRSHVNEESFSWRLFCTQTVFWGRQWEMYADDYASKNVHHEEKWCWACLIFNNHYSAGVQTNFTIQRRHGCQQQLRALRVRGWKTGKKVSRFHTQNALPLREILFRFWCGFCATFARCSWIGSAKHFLWSLIREMLFNGFNIAFCRSTATTRHSLFRALGVFLMKSKCDVINEKLAVRSRVIHCWSFPRLHSFKAFSQLSSLKTS